MKKLSITYRGIDEIIPYINNPREINEQAVNAVASSIKNYGFKNPIIIDKNNEIIAGHTRLEAAKKLGIEKVPTIMADDLNEAQVKAFRIADNKTSEFSEWDEELLRIEIEDLADEFTGFSNEEVEDLLETEDLDDNPYSLTIKTPHYEITGEKPDVDELYDDRKAQYLIERIEQADIDEDIKKMLKVAATRHIVFDYGKMAEFYAHADKEVQELMEDSALVIIDFDNAIENGYVQLSKTLEDLIDEEE